MQKVLGIVGIVGIKFKFNNLKIYLLGICWELIGNLFKNNILDNKLNKFNILKSMKTVIIRLNHHGFRLHFMLLAQFQVVENLVNNTFAYFLPSAISYSFLL
ncbi:hypothetical protein SAMN02746062_00895 [Alysiella filiformis DSM 16848]|uniref:Uncharacterized protein n=1 Tax=Alysiella filiformis DSM 16848 TaxID=1120981 RepID=A0A286E934_9NEIS|nr:hypothetical protein SAMN02746062_00895 [Alysiella filiformis DSM 16848]